MTTQAHKRTELVDNQGTPRRSAAVLLILAACGLATVGMASEALAEYRFAVIVGIDHYDAAYGAGSLPTCVNDAAGFKSALLSDSARWNASRMLTLTDSQAGKDAIREALRNMAAAAGPGDVCVYFHSSHGGHRSGTNTYLCTYNASYQDSELGEDLAAFNPQTKVVVVVDACFSGGLFKNEDEEKPAAMPGEWAFAENVMMAFYKDKAASAAKTGEELDKDLGSNIGFLTACDYTQTSECGNHYSVFVGQVINALSDAAADTNHDGFCTFWEIFSYAGPRASQQNSEQTAQSYNQTLLASTVAAAGSAGGVSSGGGAQPDGDDQFEENDTTAQAKQIGTGTYDLVGNDEDWFKITCQAGELSVQIEGPDGDLDLYIFDSEGNEVGVSNDYGSVEGLGGEVPACDLFIAVAPYEGQSGTYKLTVNVPGDAGNSGVPGTQLCGASAPLPMIGMVLGVLGLGTLRRRGR
jgi:hypothetical protein